MTFDITYSRLDRALYRLAFAGIEIQKSLSDLEVVLAGKPALKRAERPVFITALARSGTTLILELITAVEGFGSHTYRDMPFLLCPILWNRIASRFRSNSEPRERAHADGIEIGYDSPEAFEEAIWKAFWKQKYADDGIAMWYATDRNPEFLAFFVEHIRKIVTLRCANTTAPPRYVSKNNANIARIDFLLRAFPDCRILIPFRRPADFVASTLRQHRNFLELHSSDSFVLRYVDYIGHHEFGRTLKPLRFPGTETLNRYEADTADFWLRYWIGAYSYALACAGDRVVLVDYDRFAREPRSGLEFLSRALGLSSHEALTSRAVRIHPPTNYDANAIDSDKGLLQQANDLHDALVEATLT